MSMGSVINCVWRILAGTYIDPDFGQIPQSISVLRQLSVEIVLRLRKFSLVLALPGLISVSLTAPQLLRCTLGHLGQIVNECVILSQITLGEVQCLVVYFQGLIELNEYIGTLFKCSNSTPRL